MNKIRTVVVVVATALLTLTGCAANKQAVRAGATASETRTPCGPQQAPSTDGCLAAPASGLPVLDVGKTVTVDIDNTDMGAEPTTVREEWTLTKLKIVKTLGDPDAQDTAEGQYVCVEYRVKNIDQVDGDTSTAGQWVGADGKTELLKVTLSDCESIGMDESLTNTPDPKPGQYVSGSEAYDVPTDQAGAIVVSDREDTPLFRINYAPQSAAVKIAQ